MPNLVSYSQNRAVVWFFKPATSSTDSWVLKVKESRKLLVTPGLNNCILSTYIFIFLFRIRKTISIEVKERGVFFYLFNYLDTFLEFLSVDAILMIITANYP